MKTKSNKIADILDYISNELKNKYPILEIKSFENILFEHYAHISAAHLNLFKDEYINESELLNIVLATEDLKKEKPIQYVVGNVDFLDINIKVNKSVLIPRPETEELTHTIIKENKLPNPTILDLCTGSGAIALALKKNIMLSNVFAVDISDDALIIAKENAARLNLNVVFQKMDLLQWNKDYEGRNNIMLPCCDIIVSNPPYITPKEKKEMEGNVLKYEPYLALFTDEKNPLIFYEKIELFAKNHLKSSGRMYLEINALLANETMDLFSKNEYIREIKKDVFNRDRFLILQKK